MKLFEISQFALLAVLFLVRSNFWYLINDIRFKKQVLGTVYLREKDIYTSLKCLLILPLTKKYPTKEKQKQKRIINLMTICIYLVAVFYFCYRVIF